MFKTSFVSLCFATLFPNVIGLCQPISERSSEVCPGSATGPYKSPGLVDAQRRNETRYCTIVGRLCHGRSVHLWGEFSRDVERVRVKLGMRNGSYAKLLHFDIRFTVDDSEQVRVNHFIANETKIVKVIVDKPFPFEAGMPFHLQLYPSRDRLHIYVDGEWYTDHLYHPLTPLYETERLCVRGRLTIQDIAVHF